MSVSLSNGVITFIHFAFLFNIGTIRSWERKVLGTKSPGTFLGLHRLRHSRLALLIPGPAGRTAGSACFLIESVLFP